MQNEWINLEEQLPESGEQVKIKNKDGEEVWAYRGGPTVCNQCWYSIFGGQLIFNPTHWHPIPEEEKVDYSKIKPIDITDLLI